MDVPLQASALVRSSSRTRALMALKTKGPALFSTDMGRYPARDALEFMAVAVRADTEADRNAMIRHLRKKYPLECRLLTPTTAVVQDYFDGWDIKYHNYTFLYMMLQEIVRTNLVQSSTQSDQVKDVATRWRVTNEDAFHHLSLDHCLEDVFTSEDIEEYGLDIIVDVWRYLQQEKVNEDHFELLRLQSVQASMTDEQKDFTDSRATDPVSNMHVHSPLEVVSAVPHGVQSSSMDIQPHISCQLSQPSFPPPYRSSQDRGVQARSPRLGSLSQGPLWVSNAYCASQGPLATTSSPNCTLMHRQWASGSHHCVSEGNPLLRQETSRGRSITSTRHSGPNLTRENDPFQSRVWLEHVGKGPNQLPRQSQSIAPNLLRGIRNPKKRTSDDARITAHPGRSDRPPIDPGPLVWVSNQDSMPAPQHMPPHTAQKLSTPSTIPSSIPCGENRNHFLQDNQRTASDQHLKRPSSHFNSSNQLRNEANDQHRDNQRISGETDQLVSRLGTPSRYMTDQVRRDEIPPTSRSSDIQPSSLSNSMEIDPHLLEFPKSPFAGHLQPQIQQPAYFQHPFAYHNENSPYQPDDYDHSSLWIGNLPLDLTEAQKNSLFGWIREVAEMSPIKLPYPKALGGYMILRFPNPALASQAMKNLHDKVISGIPANRRLNVEFKKRTEKHRLPHNSREQKRIIPQSDSPNVKAHGNIRQMADYGSQSGLPNAINPKSSIESDFNAKLACNQYRNQGHRKPSKSHMRKESPRQGSDVTEYAGSPDKSIAASDQERHSANINAIQCNEGAASQAVIRTTVQNNEKAASAVTSPVNCQKLKKKKHVTPASKRQPTLPKASEKTRHFAEDSDVKFPDHRGVDAAAALVAENGFYSTERHHTNSRHLSPRPVNNARMAKHKAENLSDGCDRQTRDPNIISSGRPTNTSKDDSVSHPALAREEGDEQRFNDFREIALPSQTSTDTNAHTTTSIDPPTTPVSVPYERLLERAGNARTTRLADAESLRFRVAASSENLRPAGKDPDALVNSHPIPPSCVTPVMLRSPERASRPEIPTRTSSLAQPTSPSPRGHRQGKQENHSPVKGPCRYGSEDEADTRMSLPRIDHKEGIHQSTSMLSPVHLSSLTSSELSKSRQDSTCEDKSTEDNSALFGSAIGLGIEMRNAEILVRVGSSSTNTLSQPDSRRLRDTAPMGRACDTEADKDSRQPDPFTEATQSDDAHQLQSEEQSILPEGHRQDVDSDHVQDQQTDKVSPVFASKSHGALSEHHPSFTCDKSAIDDSHSEEPTLDQGNLVRYGDHINLPDGNEPYQIGEDEKQRLMNDHFADKEWRATISRDIAASRATTSSTPSSKSYALSPKKTPSRSVKPSAAMKHSSDTNNSPPELESARPIQNLEDELDVIITELRMQSLTHTIQGDAIGSLSNALKRAKIILNLSPRRNNLSDKVMSAQDWDSKAAEFIRERPWMIEEVGPQCHLSSGISLPVRGSVSQDLSETSMKESDQNESDVSRPSKPAVDEEEKLADEHDEFPPLPDSSTKDKGKINSAHSTLQRPMNEPNKPVVADAALRTRGGFSPVRVHKSIDSKAVDPSNVSYVDAGKAVRAGRSSSHAGDRKKGDPWALPTEELAWGVDGKKGERKESKSFGNE